MAQIGDAMKFKTEKLPDSIKRPAQIGNVYPCRGGCRGNSPKMWMLISIDDGYGVLLGLNGDGAIISGGKYAIHAMHAVQKWPVVGFCKGAAGLELTLELY